MKTTVDLPDDLLLRARQAARRERTTLRALLAEGLRLALRQRRTQAPAFRLRDGSFEGKGLHVGVSPGEWTQIRDLAYEGRGG